MDNTNFIVSAFSAMPKETLEKNFGKVVFALVAVYAVPHLEQAIKYAVDQWSECKHYEINAKYCLPAADPGTVVDAIA